MCAHRTLAWLAAALVATTSLAAPARGDALADLGVKRLNADAQLFWDPDGLTTIRTEAANAFQKLVGVPHKVNDKTTATITKIHSITLDCPRAPGLTSCDPSRIAMRMPLTGTWTIGASVDVYVKGKVLGIKVDRTYRVDVEVKDIAGSIAVDIDSTDPVEPKVKKLHPAKVDWKLKVKTSSWVLNVLSWLTRPLVNGVAEVATFVGARYLNKKLNVALVGAPKVLGAGGPGLAAVAPPKISLESAALAIEAQTLAFKMPNGCVLDAHYDKPYTGTWEDSLTQRGFDPGRPRKEDHWAGDSGEYTSDFLAALAFRYGATKAPDALARAKAVLKTTRMLLTMRGEPGNMNRCVTPYDPAIQLGDKYVKSYQGVDYIFSDYMSRDEYTGICFGLFVAYDCIDDPATRQDASEQFQMALDYLVKNGWTWRKKDGSFGERWAGCVDQQYAWVVAAHRMNPAKYAKLLEEYKGFADIGWAGVWSGVADPFFQYYKFGLSYSSLYVALRAEQDPARWQRLYRSLAILRRYLGHHQNAQYNVTYVAFDPASRKILGDETENLLTRWLKMPRRSMIFDLRNDPTIEQVEYKPAFDTMSLAPGQGNQPPVKIAKYPVPLEKRISASFVWCRSPYSLSEDYIWSADPTKEGESVDFTWPYWQARYFGALK